MNNISGRRRTMRRLRSLVITLAVVAVTNIAISNVFASRSLGPKPGSEPKPKSLGPKPGSEPKPKSLGPKPGSEPRP